VWWWLTAWTWAWVHGVVVDSVAWVCRSRPRLADLFLLSSSVVVVKWDKIEKVGWACRSLPSLFWVMVVVKWVKLKMKE
jgi:hypothetical protein